MLNEAQVGEQTPEGQPSGTPADSSTAAGTQQTSSPASQQGVNQTAEPRQTDWRQSPEFRGIAKENRRYKEQLEKQSQELAEMRGMMQAFRQGQGQSSVKPEDEQALMTVFSAALQSPQVMKMLEEKLGLGKIKELDEGFKSFSNSFDSQQSETEMSKVLEYAKSQGLSEDEVRSNLEQLAEEHPIYSQVGYKPGVWRSMFNDKYFDQIGALRESALNKKKLEEKEVLRRGQTQGTANSPGQKGGTQEKDPSKKWGSLVQQAGGLGNIDFTR